MPARVAEAGRADRSHLTSVGSWRLASVEGRDWLAVTVLVLVAATIDLYRSGSTSLWLDEAFSLDLVRQSLPVVLHNIWGIESNMSLYYAVLWAWLSLVHGLGGPQNEFVLRLPSVAFAVLSVVVVWQLGRLIVGRWAGFVAASLYLLNYVQLMEAAQARSYSLQLLLVCLSWYCLLAGLDARHYRRWWWLAYALVLALAIYAHLISVLVLVAQLVAYAALLVLPTTWRAQAHAELVSFLKSLGLVSFLVLPLAVDAAIHGSSGDWVQTVDAMGVYRLLGALSGANALYALLLAAMGGLAVLGAGRSVALRGRPAQMQSSDVLVGPTVLMGSWLCVPLVLAYAASQPGHNLHLFQTRYMAVLAPPLCLLVAIGLAYLARRELRLAAAATVALVLAALPAVPLYYSRVQREDLKTAASWVSQRYRPGDGVACLSRGCSLAMDYYMPAQFSSDSPGKVSWTEGTSNPVGIGELMTFADAHPRVFLILGAAGQQIDIDAARVTLEQRFVLIGALSAPDGSAGTVSVWLYMNPQQSEPTSGRS